MCVLIYFGTECRDEYGKNTPQAANTMNPAGDVENAPKRALRNPKRRLEFESAEKHQEEELVEFIYDGKRTGKHLSFFKENSYQKNISRLYKKLKKFFYGFIF